MSNLTVHHLQIGQGERVPFLLEELSIPYTLRLYQRDPIFSPPSLRALHPMGTSPLLEDATDDPANPLIMAECGAIFDYIIHRYGNGRLALPPAHPNYAVYLYWFHFSNGTLQPALARRIGIKPDDSRYKLTLDKLLRAVQHVNERLAVNTWLAGEEFTAADIMNVWCFTTMRKFSPLDLTDFPAVREWLKRCTERPAYREAMRNGDPELVIEDLVSAKGPTPFAPVVKNVEKESGTQKL